MMNLISVAECTHSSPVSLSLLIKKQTRPSDDGELNAEMIAL